MVIITLQREKCIGCNYCVELGSEHFRMSKKDGKCVLLKSVNNKGFHTFKSPDHSIFEKCKLAAQVCPVKIISVKEI